MATIVSSSATAGIPQADGRCYITESHFLSNGEVRTFEYLAGAEVDTALVMQLRAENLAAELAAQEVAAGLATLGETPLTKLEFRRRFSPAEMRRIDAFNAMFESHPALTDEQKADIRTALKNYEVANEVLLSDPDTQAGVMMYEALGMLDYAGRAQEILNG